MQTDPAVAEKHFLPGVVVILVFLGFDLVGSVLNVSQGKVLEIGTISYGGYIGISYFVITTLIELASFVGIIMRFNWSRLLLIAYRVFTFLLGLINTTAFFTNKAMVNSVYQIAQTNLGNNVASFVIMFTFGIMFIFMILDLWTIWYLLTRRKYFIR